MTKPTQTIHADAHVDERIEVEIEINDLDDDELRGCLQEALKRKLLVGFEFDRDYVERAYQELRGGRPSSALCLLERALYGAAKKADAA